MYCIVVAKWSSCWYFIKFWNSHFQIQLNSCVIKEALCACLKYHGYSCPFKLTFSKKTLSLKCGSTAKRWFERLEQMAASIGASGDK